MYVNAALFGDSIRLFYAGGSGYETVPAEYIAYFKRETTLPRDRRIVSVLEEGDWLRVAFAKPHRSGSGERVDNRETFCRSFEAQSYEGDVHPVRRWMSDNAPKIAVPRRAYLDIETDSRQRIDDAKAGGAAMLSWAIVGCDGRKMVGVLRDESEGAEQDLFGEMWSVLSHYDQVVAWNGKGFDFPVIMERSKYLECMNWDDWKRILWLDHLLAFKRYNTGNSGSGEEKQSYKLDAVAHHLLGEGKHDVHASQIYQLWKTDPDKLLRYNLQDTELLPRIEAKTGYLELARVLAEVCNNFSDTRAMSPTAQVDGYMLRLGREQGVHFASKWYSDAGPESDDAEFQGAYVMAPQTNGIERDVYVVDFASLYPSIIRTFNLSPDTKDANGACTAPETGVRTSTDREGIICTALRQLMEKRTEYKALAKLGDTQAKRAELVVKIAANAFYGVLGNRYSRFFDLDLSSSTTAGGRWLIHNTIEEAKRRGITVVYGDTDSSFMKGLDDEGFASFVKDCNETLYPSLLAPLGVRENVIRIAADKVFEHIVFTAAKRYVGKVRGKDRPEIKGLEYNRGDTNRLVRNLQKECIDMIVRAEFDYRPYVDVVLEARRGILEGVLDIGDIALTQSIKGPLGTYKANTPHVRIARILEERGEDVGQGTRVGYIVTDGYSTPKKVIPAEDYDGTNVDRWYLWEEKVYPPTQRLLEKAFPEHNWAQYNRTWDKRALRGQTNLAF